ncbi:hypothetical protein [Methanospirillum hungatei]|uniref:hypothetical protein n=1 Tax=Methanospirillum hungatei TaxID=2203 RepID=UPI0026ED5741|nr:hypothetical protein [Methanospirillum hungatei]MCA1916074.1 hypothetical protein [Methanospirillum hungatei]
MRTKERARPVDNISSAFSCILIILLCMLSAGSPVYGEHTPSFAAFGEISFSEGVTEESVPIRPVTEYEPGTVKISAVFPFMNMEDGMSVEVEWLYNDEWFYSTEEEWDEGEEGITHRSISWEDDRELEPGVYTLRLFINGQLARSADVEVLAPGEEVPEEPVRNPEDLIDSDLMKAWEILAYADNDLLQDLASLVPDYGIELRLTDEIDSSGQYVYTSGKKEPGIVYISWDSWKKTSWEEVSATIAHELTHAVQHLTSDEGTFGCTVEREYEAYMAKFYVLMETGRTDILRKNWSAVYNPRTGKIWKNELWKALKEAYSSCPEY